MYLASAIADSSVTIPGVVCVLDTCRALEVRWNLQKQATSPRTVWVSTGISKHQFYFVCWNFYFTFFFFHFTFIYNRRNNTITELFMVSNARLPSLSVTSARVGRVAPALAAPSACSSSSFTSST